MANNLLVLAILCTSGLILPVSVNGDEINNEGVHNRSLVSRKSKRAIDFESSNFSNQNDLSLHSPQDANELNESPTKEDTLSPQHPISKRAPSGFTGMRGKKQQEYTDLSPNDLDWSFDDEYPYNDIRYKKAPSGFNGVRGKKMDQYNPETSLLDQLLRRLSEERNEQLDTYRYNTPSQYPMDYFENIDFENSVEKRAPVGFTGMRGKRPLDLPFDGGKRNPNAFFGVRGKRGSKRSAMEQFNYGYFGMRGKKQPNFHGFRNKFVGVRGKKDNIGSGFNRFDSQLLDMPESSYRSSPRFLVEPAEYMTLKRTPNGFLGMRGKRQVNTDTLDNDNVL